MTRAIPVLLLLSFVIFGCVATTVHQKQANESYQFLVLSNAEYDQIMTEAATKNLTEDQKDTLILKAEKYYSKYKLTTSNLLNYKKKLDAGMLTELDSARLKRYMDELQDAFIEFVEYAESLEVAE